MTEQHLSEIPAAVLGRILLYVRDIEAVARFYVLHFGFRIHREAGDRIVELESPGGVGCNIMLHPLGRGRKSGQTVANLCCWCSTCATSRCSAPAPPSTASSSARFTRPTDTHSPMLGQGSGGQLHFRIEPRVQTQRRLRRARVSLRSADDTRLRYNSLPWSRHSGRSLPGPLPSIGSAGRSLTSGSSKSFELPRWRSSWVDWRR